MNSFTLTEPFRLEGSWGLPAMPSEEWIHGSLEYDPSSGARLNLAGAFRPARQTANYEFALHEIVLGVVRDLQSVILIGCTGVHAHLVLGNGAPFVGDTEYRVSTILLGEHVNSETDAKFESLVVRYHNLEAFIGTNAFKVEAGSGKMSVNYSSPEPISFRFGDIQLTLEYGLLQSAEHFSVDMNQYAELTAKADTALGLSEFLGFVLLPFQYLVQMAAGRRAPVLSIVGLPSSAEIEIENRRITPRISIIRSLAAGLMPTPPMPKRMHPYDFLFTLASLGPQAGDYLTKWYESLDPLRSVYDFYFSLDPEFDRDVAGEFHFLSIVLAIEGFHIASGEIQFSESEQLHEKRVRRTVDASAAEDREWLQRKLADSNRISLRGRLQTLVAKQPPKVQQLLGDPDRFCKAIAETRNRLAHGSVSRGRRALAGVPLWLATKQLRLILQVCFFRQMGLPDSLVETVVLKSPEARTLSVNRNLIV